MCIKQWYYLEEMFSAKVAYKSKLNRKYVTSLFIQLATEQHNGLV
jgi:hypothetical protein